VIGTLAREFLIAEYGVPEARYVSADEIAGVP